MRTNEPGGELRFRVSGQWSIVRSASFALLLLAVLLALVPGPVGAIDEIHWTPLGPGGGGNSFAWGVSPVNPNIVLAASDVGGIFRSADGGVTWLPRNQVSLRPDHSSSYGSGIIGQFTFNPPSGDQNVVYFGARKSTDAGNTWNINVDETTLISQGTAVDPVNPNYVYVYGYGNIYRSTDAFSGTSCEGSSAGGTQCGTPAKACRKGMKCYQAACYPHTSATSLPGCINHQMRTNGLIVDPANHSQLLACTDVGFFKSTDSGTTWNRNPNDADGLPAGLPGLCTGGTEPGSSCTSATELADCGAGGTCVASICGGSGAVCSSDAECQPNPGDTQTCQNGRCGGDGSQCWLGSDCDQGQVCNSLNCASMTMANDASHTLYITLRTRPKISAGATGGSGQDPWVDIDQWQGGVFKSTNFGNSWTQANGAGDGLDLLANKNPSFEQPLGTPGPNFAWVIPTSDQSYVSRVCSPEPAHSGTCSIKVVYPQQTCSGGPNNGNACTDDQYCAPGGCSITRQINAPEPAEQSYPATSLLQVTGGSLYKLRAWYKVTNGTTYTSYVKVHWFKSDRTPLLFAGKPWHNLEPWVQTATPENPRNYDWQKFETVVRAPDGAQYAGLDFRAGVGTAIWIDDVSFQATQDLPRITGGGQSPWFASYSTIAVPRTDTSGNVAYVTTLIATTATQEGTDATGVWRTLDGGNHWELMTRALWHDNVVDNSRYEPAYGDGVCGGRWETCDTSPGDCDRDVCSGGYNDGFLCDPSGTDPCPGGGSCNPPTFCCGDATCEALSGENRKNCPVDCYDPGDHDPVRQGQNENCTALYGGYGWYATHCNNSQSATWSLDIGLPQGGDIPDDLVIYSGNQHLKTADGGLTWQDMTSVPYTAPLEEPGAGTVQGRGANDVFTFYVVKDSRVNPPRLYNGDTDNRLVVSYNNGTSFTTEGWQWGGWYRAPQDTSAPLLDGDSATSIALDPSNANKIYVGVATGAGSIQYGNYQSGVVKGTYVPKSGSVVGHWNWSRLGTFAGAGTGGGIDLALDTSGAQLYAAYYSHGVFKLQTPTANENTPWTNTYTGSNWNPVPVNWKVYRIKQEPTTGRLYVGAGDPQYPHGPAIPAGETGVWESNDLGQNWCRTSTFGFPLNDNDMDQEAVRDLVPMGADSLLVATAVPDVHPVNDGDAAGNYTGDGGIYKGIRVGNCTWNWTRVMRQPQMSGLAVSPVDRSTVYAFAGQEPGGGDIVTRGQKAGIYRSDDEGVTWYSVINDGLGNLSNGLLNMSDTDANILYASTIGTGSFQGTRSCTNPTTEAAFPPATCFDGQDNDCDGVVDFDCSFDPTNQTIVGGAGVIVSGSMADLKGRPDRDAWETVKEKNLGTKPLDVVWTFSGMSTGQVYYLNVEGFRVPGGNDTFTFKYKTKASGTCNGSEGTYTTLPLTLGSADSRDTDVVKKASIGTVTSGLPVVCIRLVDSGVTDSTQDFVSLDRVYLFPEPPGKPAASDHQTVIGSITSGSYTATISTDNVRESLREALDATASGQSRLEHIWKFDGVPIGSSHQLDIEGYRIPGSDAPVDNFQFSYSTDGINFSDISGALIDYALEPPSAYSFPFGPAGIGGTIYIRVKDTNTTSGTSLDTVNIDRIGIKTIP